MLRFYLTVDTELSSGHFARRGRAGLDANFASAIDGRTGRGPVGVAHQIDVLDAHGMKGVFFVDPLPALAVGIDVIKRIVHPILEREHDVQLHAHSEWLSFATRSPVGGRTGRNMKDFDLADQTAILEVARDCLVEAGAPAPVAFRAGNYGADDNTLRALARLGIRYDTSLTPGIKGGACDISIVGDRLEPVEHLGVIEVPVAAIAAARGGRRHAQLTALSAGEILAALDHAVAQRQTSFTLVSHSFELLARERGVPNRIVTQRFERLCAGIAARAAIESATYANQPPEPGTAYPSLLPHNPIRTAIRLVEQAASNALYSRRPLFGLRAASTVQPPVPAVQS
ncbi:hypothetical protein WG908_07535 [Sphingobium sp. AN641]|uniref:polysaccharide deacetylase family protein n=1 Tax=Sphingobium sp. AN641 TaxID=3133443 RepID=UPI0030C46587